jgi:hypothetical protein
MSRLSVASPLLGALLLAGCAVPNVQPASSNAASDMVLTIFMSLLRPGI